MDVRFSVNAVQEFVARVRTDLRYPAALALLQDNVKNVSTRERLDGGDAFWQVPTLGCGFIVRHTHGGAIVAHVVPAGDSPADVAPAPVKDAATYRNEVLGRLYGFLEKLAKKGDHEAQKHLDAMRHADLF